MNLRFRTEFARLRRGVALAVALGCGWLGMWAVSAAGVEGSPATRSRAPEEDLFSDQPIPALRLRVGPAEWRRLREDRRGYVAAELEEPGVGRIQVAVHLKGTLGSLRPLEGKPSWTVDVVRFEENQRWHGLRKFHLNNAVEDPSYFHERLGQWCFDRAGLPAPRVGHALVYVNGRRLGLYVLKEGVTEEFLQRWFRDARGHMYEPGEGHDVDEALRVSQREPGADGRELARLTAVLREASLERRWADLPRVLDVDSFTSFLALEIMLGHRDGYALARNNFRIYHDPARDLLVFLPQGMDQLLGRADATMWPAMQGVVARALMEIPAGRARYRERWTHLVARVFDEAAVHALAESFLRRARPLLTRSEAAALEGALRDIEQRFHARRIFLEEERRLPEPVAVTFAQGRVRLEDWRPVDEPKGGRLQRDAVVDGRPALLIEAGPQTSASWRTTVRLPAGTYRFGAEVRVRGVVPLPFGRNRGAGLRVVPGDESAPHALVGDGGWTRLQRGLTIATERDVELLCELRARAGRAWFALDSLVLERVP